MMGVRKNKIGNIIGWVLLIGLLGFVALYMRLSLTQYGFKGSIQRAIPKKWNGVYKEYYENGTLKLETEYRFGREHGIQKQYYEDGSLSEIVEYKNGIPISGKRYYGTGELLSVLSFKDGKADGVIKRYYKDGTLRGEIIMEKGKWKEIREYYENGNMKFEKSSAKRWRKEYDAQGNLVFEGGL
jgi:antitoxin component YwqK of YwqJK toxin-antitoxin module